jgi:hypothetical protein
VIPHTGIGHTCQEEAPIWHKSRIAAPESWADSCTPGRKSGDMIRGHVINVNPGNLLSVYALIMAANVWFVIWPNQQRVLGLVEADDARKASSARTALIASRLNVLLSIPMLYAMTTYQTLGS